MVLKVRNDKFVGRDCGTNHATELEAQPYEEGMRSTEQLHHINEH